MEYIGIGICAVAAIAICAVLILRSKKKDETPSKLVESHEEKAESEPLNIEEQNELIIRMEMLPAEAIEDESKLVEITDSKVLAHVNNLIPSLVQAGN